MQSPLWDNEAGRGRRSPRGRQELWGDADYGGAEAKTKKLFKQKAPRVLPSLSDAQTLVFALTVVYLFTVNLFYLAFFRHPKAVLLMCAAPLVAVPAMWARRSRSLGHPGHGAASGALGAGAFGSSQMVRAASLTVFWNHSGSIGLPADDPALRALEGISHMEGVEAARLNELRILPQSLRSLSFCDHLNQCQMEHVQWPSGLQRLVVQRRTVRAAPRARPLGRPGAPPNVSRDLADAGLRITRSTSSFVAGPAGTVHRCGGDPRTRARCTMENGTALQCCGSATKDKTLPQDKGWSSFSEGSAGGSLALLISAAIGTGVLALPYGVSCVGIWGSLALFAFAGVFTYYSNTILFDCVLETSHGSYGQLMSDILGKYGGMTLDLFVFVEGLGAVATYVVFIMDYVPQVFRRGEVVPNSCRGAAPKYVRRYCSMGHAGQALSQGCLKGLSALRYTSTCSIATIVFTCLVVFFKAPSHFAAQEATLQQVLSQARWNRSSFQVLSMACFAFMRLGLRGEAGAPCADGGAVGSLLRNCCEDTKQDFLTNYDVQDKLIVMCRCLLSVTLVFACPLNMFPAVQALFNVLEHFRPPHRHHEGLYENDLVRVPVSTLAFAITLGVALKSPHVADLISTISAYFSSPLMFAFPAVMHWKILRRTSNTLPWTPQAAAVGATPQVHAAQRRRSKLSKALGKPRTVRRAEADAAEGEFAKPFPFSAVVGQEEIKLALLLNLVDPSIGGVMISGDRGTGKSTTVRGMVRLLPNIDVARHLSRPRRGAGTDLLSPNLRQCDVQERVEKGEKLKVTQKRTPFDRVTGTIDIERALKEAGKAFEPGILARVNRGILYIDECNLLDDQLVDVLLDSAAGGVNTVEREGVSVRHPARFVLIGTSHPDEGDLRPQLLDRFGLTCSIRTALAADRRKEVLSRAYEWSQNPEKIEAQWASTDRNQKCAQTRGSASFQKAGGGSQREFEECEDAPRVGLGDLQNLLQAQRRWTPRRHRHQPSGRTEVTEEDVRRVTVLCLQHRLRKDVVSDTLDNTALVVKALLQEMGKGPPPIRPVMKFLESPVAA
eukprot:g27306.t1